MSQRHTFLLFAVSVLLRSSICFADSELKSQYELYLRAVRSGDVQSFLSLSDEEVRGVFEGKDEKAQKELMRAFTIAVPCKIEVFQSR